MANREFQYSNGFDLKRVLTAMEERLGWIQPTVSGSIVLDPSNVKSLSGRYFNDGSFHRVVTPGNILSSQEDPGIDAVKFNALLKQLRRSAILRSLNNVFNEQETIERVSLYDRYGSNDSPVNNTGKFVGYEINLAKTFDRAERVNSASLYFDQDATFKLYLFKDAAMLPIWEQEVSAEAYVSTEIDIPDLYLSYQNGGRYYLGYFQDDLNGARAIQEQVSCWNKTLLFSACAFTSDAIGSDFNREERSYPSLPAGLNLEMSSFVDWTKQVVAQPSLFDNLVGLNMAYMVIEDIIYTLRSNKGERGLKDNIAGMGVQLDLNGAIPMENGPQTKGLKQRIDAEAQRIKDTFVKKPKAQTVNLC